MTSLLLASLATSAALAMPVSMPPASATFRQKTTVSRAMSNGPSAYQKILAEPHGIPVRIRIPKIRVDAPVASVGVTEGFKMEVPKGPDDTGWYSPGPRPGELGSAVIAGHYGQWSRGRYAVFDGLRRLAPGDRIFVEDEHWKNVPFRVTAVRSYAPNDPVPEVFTRKDAIRLNLVTCEGKWNSRTQSYSRRLVVFSEREF